eukprot:TRINITY_DN937_c0_g1_i2.p1 TRINITY_DN937_c0_g1~~TRINITY_DN937_c0_g1_i2.p1  ORF type:complete len:238 (+),score=61.19 TRINITY_DN937_c0_g1_i2:53-715(+)
MSEYCRVLYEHATAEENQLSIKPGEIIKVLSKADDEWWEGELEGKVGFFPCKFVECLPMAKVKYTFDKKGENQISLESGQVVYVLSEEDQDWWLVSLEGSLGFYPKGYLEKLDPAEVEAVAVAAATSPAAADVATAASTGTAAAAEPVGQTTEAENLVESAAHETQECTQLPHSSKSDSSMGEETKKERKDRDEKKSKNPKWLAKKTFGTLRVRPLILLG